MESTASAECRVAKSAPAVANGHAGDASEAAAEMSYLARIEVAGSDPIALFDQWRSTAEARGALMVNTMVLATVNAALEVSARTVVLRRMDGDSFVFMTDSRSRKVNDLAEHPKASVVFSWNYRLGERIVNRQVRVGGGVATLSEAAFGDLYTREPFYCQVRAHLCNQGAHVDWALHAARHDEILALHRAGRASLHERPDHVVAYSVKPDWVEFYHALDDCIGDRVLFNRAPGGAWTHQHISA